MYNFKLHWTITYLSFCYQIPVFDSLVSISMDIASFQERIKIVAITAEIKRFKLMNKKKKKEW